MLSGRPGRKRGEIVNFVKDPNNLTGFLPYGSFLPTFIPPGAIHAGPDNTWIGGNQVKPTIAATAP
jgi:hypothetical protein